MALRVFGSTFEIDKKVLVRAAKRAFLYLGDDFEVNLRFVSKEKIKELNRIYRNRDLSTDILSFKLDPSTSGGDIVICYKEAQVQAVKHRVTLSNAATFLLVHGILHLAGYEHTKTIDRVKMEKAEEDILTQSGVKFER